MTRLYPLEEDSEAAQEMVAALLPRGPIWQMRNADVAGMTAGLGDESRRFHNRMVDLMSEAYPATAEEIIAEWESTYGLPICADAPTDLASRQAAVAGAYAAQGGQDRAYFIEMIRAVLGDPAAAVTITERPYGRPFRAWASSAWDAATGVAAMHYWRVTLPSGTSPALAHVVGCLLDRYKPAHTVLELVSSVSAYYSSPGGDGEWAKASTPIAARVFFSDAGKPAGTYLCWARRPDTAGTLALVDVIHGSDDTLARLRWTDDPLLTVEVFNSLGTGATNDIAPPSPGADWHFFALVCDGTTATTYVDGDQVDSQSLGATPYGICDDFMMFALHATGEAAEGSVRNIAIFDRALSGAEIAALYGSAGAHAHDYRVAVGDWTGEVPAVYWCQSAVAQVMWSYSTESQGAIVVQNPSVGGNATFVFWLYVGAADEGAHIINGPFEIVISAGSGFVVTFESLSTSSNVYSLGEWHQFAIVADGSEHLLYIDGALDVSGVDATSLVGNLDLFGAAALAGTQYAVMNVAVFERDLSVDEVADLHSAGVTHDYGEAAGAHWAGEVPAGYWRSEPIGGVVTSVGYNDAVVLTLDSNCAPESVPTDRLRVTSSGSAGVCDLYLYANVTSEED